MRDGKMRTKIDLEGGVAIINRDVDLEGMVIGLNNALALLPFYYPGKEPEENTPENLEVGKSYKFLLNGKGYNAFPIGKAIPLVETNGEGITLPIAIIEITKTEQFISGGIVSTRGEYIIKELK